MQKEIIIFDVCNTLYNSNTTFDFIRFVLQKTSSSKLYVFNMLAKKYSPIFIGGTLLGMIQGKDLIRSSAVALLKGYKKAVLLQLADEFYSAHLQDRVNYDVLKLLEEEQQQHEVWLFSNSIDPVIQTIARYLNVAFEATLLEYNEDEVFTGRIKLDLSGKKQEAFLKRFGMDVEIKMMCSDNKSDSEILRLAKKPIVVVYKPSDKKFWQSLNPQFIEKF